MLAEGHPYKGVLYAGLILTDEGPKLLEFNCRFGDPETQVILPLLETDLVDIAEACIHGDLHKLSVSWKTGNAACVVLASKDYPYKASQPAPISGLELLSPQALLLHAGTKLVPADNSQPETILASGGRVLGVTCVDQSLEAALNKVYAIIKKIRFDGMQYRQDIGAKVLSKTVSSAYASAGVDIEAGNRAVALMRKSVKSTYGPQVLNEIGAFGGLFDISQLKQMQRPILAASTDGVGTKVALASQAEQFYSIGQDLVNHCINDILVQGAQPLFFMDYIASSKIDPEMVAAIVQGMAAACQQANCSLLGGETAEMPGVYYPDAFDLAGTIVGVVDYPDVLPGKPLCAGDLLVGLRSSGPHTNGYSLIRRIFTGADLQEINPETGKKYIEELLTPHRSYLPVLEPVLADPHKPIKALAHITGGGFPENIARILPADLNAAIQLEKWPVPSIFRTIQQRGQVSIQEMYKVFNMGIGMVIIVGEQDFQHLQSLLPEVCYLIGQLIPGEGKVELA
jgi:phosphoribosylaminoimidazole synthetase